MSLPSRENTPRRLIRRRVVRVSVDASHTMIGQMLNTRMSRPATATIVQRCHAWSCGLGTHVSRARVVAVAGLLILVFSIWPIIVWLASTDTLTTRRLISRRGVFSREGKDIPIDRVQSVSYRRTLLERMLGCGTLVVQTPATAATWSSPTSH